MEQIIQNYNEGLSIIDKIIAGRNSENTLFLANLKKQTEECIADFENKNKTISSKARNKKQLSFINENIETDSEEDHEIASDITENLENPSIPPILISEPQCVPNSMVQTEAVGISLSYPVQEIDLLEEMPPPSTETKLRPQRTAKAKANESLREPNLMCKMRQDSGTVVIKKERLSTESQPAIGETVVQLAQDLQEAVVVIKSEPLDEEHFKMPPPAAKPKPKGRKKKKNSRDKTIRSEGAIENRITEGDILPVKIKTERVSDVTKSVPARPKRTRNAKKNSKISLESSDDKRDKNMEEGKAVVEETIPNITAGQVQINISTNIEVQMNDQSNVDTSTRQNVLDEIVPGSEVNTPKNVINMTFEVQKSASNATYLLSTPAGLFTPAPSDRTIVIEKAGPTAEAAPALNVLDSAPKLAHNLKKSTSTTSLKSTTRSRDPSVEGQCAAGPSKQKMLAEEKKIKRLEKQKLAQQQREALERERIENAERVAREREEKHQKLLQEREKLRLEKLKKNEKRAQEAEERKKLEEKKRMDLQLALEEEEKNRRQLEKAKELAIRQEQEKVRALEIVKTKILRNETNLLKQIKTNELKKKHDFDNLLSEDSTDDEDDDPTKKKKQRPMPDWSTSKLRRSRLIGQSYIDTKIIDTFFSVEPMTPNLKEIFPKIDDRYLKRNSSAIWSTPPRYSELPKY